MYFQPTCIWTRLNGQRTTDLFSHIKIITRAKKGSIGAQLALMRGRAVGQRIMMYWHVDNSFYPATITAFDELHYLHRVEPDDGDTEPAVKLWESQLNLQVRTLMPMFHIVTFSHQSYFFTGGRPYHTDTTTHRSTTCKYSQPKGH